MKATFSTSLSGAVRNNNSTQLSPTSKLSRIGLTLTLAATFLCGLAVSTSAQNSDLSRIAPERDFTIAPNVQTAIVLKAQPDAECSLHTEGVSDPAADTMKLYANADGYVRVHVSARQESQEDARMQLDCAAAGTVTTYPLHLRAGSSPTEDMPAPQSAMPTPRGSRVLPALTEEDARLLSDEELLGRGYLPRPDAVSSPDKYAVWLDLVSRPITLIPPHSVSRSDIFHTTRPVEAGSKSYANWSGYEAHHAKRSYMAVEGEWSVPFIYSCESGYTTYSATWVGLDGDGTTDLVQDGTEQDCTDLGGFLFFSYSTWTELLPNQPTEQGAGLSINPGDDIVAQAWIGDSKGRVRQNGAYGWFAIFNKTQSQAVQISTPLSGTYFNGSEAEWIMERPTVGGVLSELSDYGFDTITNARAETTKSKWKTYDNIQNRHIVMYEQYNPQPDNNLLSNPGPNGSGAMYFNWFNFH
jgi:Peptidase A4 family